MATVWSCIRCTLSNSEKLPSCEACNTPRMLSNPNYNLNLSTLRESTQPKLSGELLSHSTHSQYSFGDAGKSACTLIAAMAAADLLAITSLEEASRIFCEERLNDWVSSGIHLYDRIAGGLQRGNEHTALDDIWDHDALQMTVRRLERGIPIQRISRASSFLSAIGEARSWLRNCTMKPDQNAVYSLALVITKPPETVLLVFEAGCGSSVLFDSHPRTTQRGIGGSHAIRFSTDDEAASNLSFLFPSTSGLEDCGYGAQMMNQFEAIPLRQTNYNASASKLDSNYSASSLSARKEVYDDGSFAALQAALQQARDELEASEEKCVVLADRNAELEAKVAATQGQLEVLQGIMGESRAAADGMQRRISQAEAMLSEAREDIGITKYPARSTDSSQTPMLEDPQGSHTPVLGLSVGSLESANANSQVLLPLCETRALSAKK